MEHEFTKLSPNGVRSVKGFEVEHGFANGVTYRNGALKVFLDSEWLHDPSGIVLYLKSPNNCGLAGLEPTVLNEVVVDIARALQWMGYKVEFG